LGVSHAPIRVRQDVLVAKARERSSEDKQESISIAGNLAMVMNVMGHSDVRTAMRYQHPALDPVREAIDQRNLHHKPRHNEFGVQ
jgi:hypothetical protein